MLNPENESELIDPSNKLLGVNNFPEDDEMQHQHFLGAGSELSMYLKELSFSEAYISRKMLPSFIL